MDRAEDTPEGELLSFDRVYFGDSKILITKMPDGVVDMMVLDGPNDFFSMGVGKVTMNNKIGDNWTPEPFAIELYPSWLRECYRTMRQDRILACFASSSQIYKYEEYEEKLRRNIIAAGFKYVDRIFLYEYGVGDKISSKSVLDKHAFILLFSKGDPPLLTEHKLLVSLDAREYEGERSKELMRKLVLQSTEEGMFILDMFCGGAGLGEAAIELGRKYIGVDINPLVYEKAKIRIEKAVQRLKGD